jgi:hypothetical protein
MKYGMKDPQGSTSTQALLEAARYLQSAGMSNKILRLVHHLKGETFNMTLSYFARHSELQGRNIAYAQRLILMAEQHAKTGRSWEALAQDALDRFPMS